MNKPRDIPPEAPTTPPPAPDVLPQAAGPLKAKGEALLKLLEEKRSLSWIQFATD
ncbi:MAG: hypothetical protein ACAH83_15865 [Alphaproteobacteria bacterium]